MAGLLDPFTPAQQPVQQVTVTRPPPSMLQMLLATIPKPKVNLGIGVDSSGLPMLHPGSNQSVSGVMTPTDTSRGPMGRAAGNPYVNDTGLLDAILGENNPISQWADSRSNRLQGLGQYCMSGMKDYSGITAGALLDRQQRGLAKEWDQAQQGKNGLLATLQNYGADYADIAEGLQAGYLDQASAWNAMLSRKQEMDQQAKIAATNKGNAAFIKDPELRAAVEAGALPFADAYKMERGDKQSLMNVGDGTVFDPNTREWLTNPDTAAAAPDLKELFGFEKDLWQQYANSDPVKTYEAVKGGYERVRESAAQQTGAGDMAMLYGYMRMLDPGSVVRESEFAMAAQAGSFGEQVQGMVTKLLNGQRLPESQRQEFLQNAEKLYSAASGNLSDINNQFSDRAGGYGVDPSRFIRQPENFGPPKVTTQQEYQSLPRGTQYLAPDGTIRTKP